jgi:hypothetical protein
MYRPFEISQFFISFGDRETEPKKNPHFKYLLGASEKNLFKKKVLKTEKNLSIIFSFTFHHSLALSLRSQCSLRSNLTRFGCFEGFKSL